MDRQPESLSLGRVHVDQTVAKHNNHKQVMIKFEVQEELIILQGKKMLYISISYSEASRSLVNQFRRNAAILLHLPNFWCFC